MSSAPLKKLNDGTQIPQLGLGVFQLDDDAAHRATLAAFEAGYRHVDTAAIYRNEVGVGRAIAESGLARDEIFVTTKLWNKAQGRDNARVGISRSLEKLGLSSVDLYLIHWPCPAAGRYVESWEQMIDFRSEGLTRSIGVSNFLPEHLDTIVDETGIVPSVNQIELHPTFQPDDLLNHCFDLGVVVESWSPLGQAADLEHRDILAIAEATGATPAQVIIRWHLNRGFVTIPKSANPERITANLAALDVTLTSEHMETIDGLSAGNRLGPDPTTVEP
ncbi:aldo/keto reductase [Tessaracoccus sp.]